MTEAEFHMSVVRSMARLEAVAQDTKDAVTRLEAAVLGAPIGAGGLLTRVTLLEAGPSKTRQMANDSVKGAAGGGIVAILTVLLPFLKDVMTRGG